MREPLNYLFICRISLNCLQTRLGSGSNAWKMEGHTNKEIAGRIQQRYGYAKERAERELDTWNKSL